MMICRGLDPRTMVTLMVALAELRRDRGGGEPDALLSMSGKEPPDSSALRNTLPRA